MKRIGEITPERSGWYAPPKEAQPMVKPTRDFCRDQLSRLNNKFGAPRAAEDAFRLSLVLDALTKAAESEAHAKAIIDRLETVDEFPNGYQISQAGYDLRTREKRADPKCPMCCGLGFVIIPDGGQGAGKKCSCWREYEVTTA